MATLARAQHLSIPIGPAVGMAGGLFIALTCLIMPGALLEQLVGASGAPAVVAAAEPPLGLTARIALGMMLGGGFAGFAGVGLSLFGGDRQIDFAKASALWRRRDVHPDAPPRPPLFAARDLGTPFLEVKAPVAEAGPDRDAAEPREPSAAAPVAVLAEPAVERPAALPVERPLPRDLDLPLAAYAPGVTDSQPLPPLAEPFTIAPRPALIDPGDRFETFELTPIGRATAPLLRDAPPPPVTVVPAAPTAERVVAAETEATVHDLLARLERGVSGGPGQAAGPAGSLAGTIDDLRRMAILR